MGLDACCMCDPILKKRTSCILKILKESYQRKELSFLYFMTLCTFTIINRKWDKIIFVK